MMKTSHTKSSLLIITLNYSPLIQICQALTELKLQTSAALLAINLKKVYIKKGLYSTTIAKFLYEMKGSN